MKDNLALAYAMKKKSKKMAMGGELRSGYEPMPEDHTKEETDSELVDRIMSKRKMMAEGGVVADEPGTRADEMSADYDYLSSGDLDDSTTNSGAAAGDELGNHQEDEDRADIVAKIMRSRSKKDRMPRPA